MAKKHKPEEIVAKLRQVDVLLSQGTPIADAVRSSGVTEVTYYRWLTLSKGTSSVSSVAACCPMHARAERSPRVNRARSRAPRWKCPFGAHLPHSPSDRGPAYLRTISTPSSLHFSNKKALISTAAARETKPETLSTAINDVTAADATDEPSVFTGSSVTDLAWPFSKAMAGVMVALTEKALPLLGSASSTLQMNVCSGKFTVVFSSFITLAIRARSRVSFTVH
jgi:hypothetical protein